MEKIIITIDGHSACGKSTLAKALALELDYGYIDTGAMYRAVTYFFLENRVNIQKTAELERALKKIKITFKSTVAGNRTFLNGKDVEDTIRKMFVSKNVSHVAAISTVRKMVVKQQKEMGKLKGIVMEGRDIGTVVFPKAELKIFLTADEDIRTQRRFNELKNKGQRVSLKAVKNNLLERDHIDSTRKDSPLKKAKESVVIDNSNLTQREQLTMILALAKERIRKFSLENKKQTPSKVKQSQSKIVRPANANRNTKLNTQRNNPTKASPVTKPTQNKSNQKTTRPSNANRNTKSNTQRNNPTKANPATKPTQNKSNQKTTRNSNTNRNTKSNTQRNNPTKANPATKPTQNKPNQKTTRNSNANQNTKPNTQNNTPAKASPATKPTQNKPNQKTTRNSNANQNTKPNTQNNTPAKATSNTRQKPKTTHAKNPNQKVKPTPKKGTISTSNTKKENKTNPKASQQKDKKTVSQRRVYKKRPTDKKSS